MAGPSTIAARLNWLLDVSDVTVPAEIDPEGRLRRSNHDIGAELHRRLGLRPAWSWAARVATARRGGPAEPGMLVEIARIFNAHDAYFAMQRSDLARAQAALLDASLARHRYTHRRCRQPDSIAVAELEEWRTVLHFVRADDPAGSIPADLRTAEPQSSTAPCDRPCQDSYPTEAKHDAESSTETQGGCDEMAEPLPELRLEQLCQDLVREGQLGLPLDVWELCEAIGRSRGRRVKVIAAPLGGTTSVGHLVALRTSDKIFFDEAAPHSQQVQIICHEVMHLVRGHLDGQDQLTCGALLEDATAPPTHNLYASWQEWEAEVGATILARLAHDRATPNAPARRTTELGLAGAFGLRERL